MEEYGKIVYLDADCLVVGSADQLFATCRDVAFAAAPALYPPDTFDGGVLVMLLEYGIAVVRADGADLVLDRGTSLSAPHADCVAPGAPPRAASSCIAA